MPVILSQAKQELNQVDSQISIQLNINQESDEFIFSPDFLQILNMLSFLRKVGDLCPLVFSIGE